MPDPLVRRIRKETRKVCASICGVLHISNFAILCAGGNKFGKNNWSKGHGKSKSYSSGSSWDKKGYGQARSW